MGNPQGFRHAARILNVLTRATRAFAPRHLAMIVELERNTNHVVALPLQQGCDNRGIHPSRHGDNHAGVGGPARQIKIV